MNDFNFKSAGSKIKERDITTSTTPSIGLTSFALVGETMKGPAFEPITVINKAEFRKVFGSQSNEKFGGKLKHLLPFYANSFLEESDRLTAVRVLGLSGYEAGKSWAITVKTATGETGDANYNNMVVAVLRSRGSYDQDGVQQFYVSGLTMSTVSGDAHTDITKQFTLQASGSRGGLFTCSLNPDSPDFISKVLGTTNFGKASGLFVESVFPDLLRKAITDGLITGVVDVIELNAASSGGYKTKFRNAVTPYFMSEVRGSEIQKLFRVVTISDGDSANKEIKISIENIDPVKNEFDLVVRDFNDTDESVIVLERYSKCNMNPASASFVGRRIGSLMEGENLLDYDINSKYIYLEMAYGFPTDAVPCGFEGYELRKYVNTTGGTLNSPVMNYKTSYTITDKIGRTYLGLSERANDTTGFKGTGVNQNLFNFAGDLVASGTTKTKGFHLDSDATSDYEVGIGSLKTKADIEGTSAYADKKTRKFTCVPYGGFDGWDIYREERTNTDSFRSVEGSDWYAFMGAISTLSNPEDVDIDILATPNLDWSNHNSLVKETLEMVENERADCLYIIDAPELSGDATSVEEIAELFEIADIDSSYAATYFPHIQVEDAESRALVYIPPTGEVARTMAYTDKVKAAWWANAGLTRGLIPNAKKAKIKLKEDHRDTLAEAKINAIAQFREVGVDVFAQRTTQKKSSALDRINVRRMMFIAQRIVKQIANAILFDPNDDNQASQFLAKVNPKLADIKRDRGIKKFRVEVDDSMLPEAGARNQRYFVIRITPMDSLEEIGLTFELNDEGVKFTE